MLPWNTFVLEQQMSIFDLLKFMLFFTAYSAED